MGTRLGTWSGRRQRERERGIDTVRLLGLLGGGDVCTAKTGCKLLRCAVKSVEGTSEGKDPGEGAQTWMWLG